MRLNLGWKGCRRTVGVSQNVVSGGKTMAFREGVNLQAGPVVFSGGGQGKNLNYSRRWALVSICLRELKPGGTGTRLLGHE